MLSGRRTGRLGEKTALRQTEAFCEAVRGLSAGNSDSDLREVYSVFTEGGRGGVDPLAVAAVVAAAAAAESSVGPPS